MSDNILVLPGITREGKNDLPPRPDIAELFEQLAAKARDGEIQAAAVCFYEPNGEVLGTFIASPEVGFFQMLGGVEYLKEMIMQEKPDPNVYHDGDISG